MTVVQTVYCIHLSCKTAVEVDSLRFIGSLHNIAGDLDSSHLAIPTFPAGSLHTLLRMAA